MKACFLFTVLSLAIFSKACNTPIECYAESLSNLKEAKDMMITLKNSMTTSINDCQKSVQTAMQQVMDSMAKVGRNPWVSVGNINPDFDKLLQQYPPTIYEWGTNYNQAASQGTLGINRLQISHWNRGIRITQMDEIPFGDDGAHFSKGRSTWTRDTDDVESKGQNFYHRYVDQNLVPIGGGEGKYAGIEIFVRYW